MFFKRAFEGANDWWRWLVTIFLVLLAYIFGQIPFSIVYFFGIMDSDTPPVTPDEVQEVFTVIDMKAAGIDLNFGLFLLLLMFVFMGGAYFCL